MKELSPQLKYQICKSNDSTYDGSFYLGVHSTKIYCIPSCKAKMPLVKNVKYYPNKEDAVEAGLRGCKRCRSEFFPLTQPDWYNTLINFLENNLNQKLNEEDFEIKTGVNISTIRRYFIEYKRMTPSNYHRKIRLRYARKLLKNEPLMDVPYMTGFSSMSGFRSAFYKEFGFNPGEKK